MNRSTVRTPERRAWATDVLSGFVVLSLIAVLLTPIAVQRRVHALRDEIEHGADPARTLVTQVQYLLARQTSTLRGYLLTGDEQFLRGFEALRLQEAGVYGELDGYVDRLGGPTVAPYAELRTLSREWHDRLDQGEITRGRESTLTLIPEVPFDQPLYLDALEAASRLDQALVAATQLRRREITRAERQGFLMNVVLGLLALASAVAVAYLSYRYRLLAREAEARRIAAEEALQEKVDATDARSRLLRGVTHDVKNPLGAADAYAELLEMGLKGPLTPDQLDFLGKMRRSIRSALEIIHDLLDLGGAETGNLQLSRRPTEIGGVLQEVADEHLASALRAGHSLQLRLAPDIPEVVTDSARVRQVVGNLLSNAIKYTPAPGKIEVVAALAERAGSTPGEWLAIRVIDSGPGIAPEHRETIFEEFSRLHSGAIQGYGLGLAITRRIARLLQGDVTVDSAPGGGAEFVVWLPLDPRVAVRERDADGARIPA